MNNSQLPIAVAGGGIGGLTAALALSRIGIPVHLFEQAHEIKEIGAGIQLGPNAFHILKHLGITDQVNQLASFPNDLVVMDSLSGEQVMRISTGTHITERFGYPYGLIHRADLHQVLLQACMASPLIDLSTATKVVDFEDIGSHVVVALENGEKVDAAALIGADGLWSKVRERIIGDGKPRVSGHIAYRAVLPIDAVPEENRTNCMTLWAGPKNHLVHYPLRGGKLFNLVAVFHSDRYDEGWDSFGEAEELILRFKGVVPAVQQMLEKIESWRMWVLCDREPIKDWSLGRTTLLGDAAHPTLQYLAQGACMAMEDAVCLANKVASMPGAYEAAFKAYDQTRYQRTARVQLTARLYGQVYHAVGASRDLRNSYLNNRSPQQFLDGNAWLYDPKEVDRAIF
ncbi:MAG: 3-hydroxybenzoate 6-monooxygenase [Rhodocyclaceae bacterium]|nr:MAG: 3-hydroxybenzoate 6-monooxygenase [Rhodocyclaceae bacterium]